MDAVQEREEENGIDFGSKSTNLLSLLQIATTASVQHRAEESKYDNAARANKDQTDFTQLDFERSQALQVFKNLMRPIDGSLSCDIKPQVPSIRALANTCGIDFGKAFQKVNQSTVKVMSDKQETGGSGFYACSSDKTFCAIATNDHVVKKASDLSAFLVFQEGVGASQAEVILQDPKNDIALLKVRPEEKTNPLFPQTDLKPVLFAPNLTAGESIFTVCNPTKTTFATFVSPGKVKETNQIPIITDAPNSPRSIISMQQNYLGCSGGATFNRFGELIGIVRAVGPGQMVNIKAAHLQKLLDSEARRIRGW